MKYFRVKIGYGKDEFISVDENEVATAFRAQVNGGVAVFKEGTVSGNHIISILPDYNREMGYNRDYVLQGEDYAEIGAKKQEDYRLFLEDTKLALEGKKRGEPIREIPAGVKALASKMNIPTRDR